MRLILRCDLYIKIYNFTFVIFTLTVARGRSRLVYQYLLSCTTVNITNGHQAADKKCGVSEKLVRDWRKAEVTLTAMKKTKKANLPGETCHVQLHLHAQVVAKAGATYTPERLIYVFFFFFMHFLTGATYTPVRLIVRKIRYSGNHI